MHFAGVGLHSGRIVTVRIYPAPLNHGVTFCRSDVQGALPIKASPESISSTRLSTCIGHEAGQEVATIEHLMAAFGGLGIDNARVLVNAPEIPILDGSSAPFVDQLVEGGVQIQGSRRKVFIPRQTIEVGNEHQFVRLEPWQDRNDAELLANPQLEIKGHIDFPRSQVIGRQALTLTFSRRSFLDLCEARTFCHFDDITAMRKNGLALGGSLDNAVVVNDTEIVNNDGLRYPDEFVRHKILDGIGDLSMLGGALCGRLTLHCAGHGLHAAFMQKFLASPVDVFPVSARTRQVRLGGDEGFIGAAAAARKL